MYRINSLPLRCRCWSLLRAKMKEERWIYKRPSRRATKHDLWVCTLAKVKTTYVGSHFCKGRRLLRYNAVTLTWNGLQPWEPITGTIFFSQWRCSCRANANNIKFSLFILRKRFCRVWREDKQVTTFSAGLVAGKCRLQWLKTCNVNFGLPSVDISKKGILTERLTKGTYTYHKSYPEVLIHSSTISVKPCDL